MKNIFLFFCLLTSSFLLQAQAPQGIPYQAIARNASGVAIANTAVKVRFSIRDSIATGAIKYQETHSPTTSALGLFSVNVGMGTVVSGTFSGINWGKNAKFLRVELDPAGGSNYIDLGTTQMMSVPYALNAANGVANGTAANQLNYWNGNLWVSLAAPQSQGQILTFCNGALTWTTGGVCPAVLPTITTTAASAITSTSASAGGNISSDGGASITARGVCWSTSPNPTITQATRTNNGAGTGIFTSSITGLSPNTLYYVRSYATNSVGTAYGNQISLTTSVGNTISDIDGNTYQTIAIGAQIWMKENLKTRKYRNGDAIGEVKDQGQWAAIWNNALTQAAWCYYDNDSLKNATFGKIYNAFAVNDPRGLCPVGWHVPSDVEWSTLENFLGGQSVAGGAMKSVSTIWTSPNTGATNSSEFSGLPGGHRTVDGTFYGLGIIGYWWTSTDIFTWRPNNWLRFLNYDSSQTGRYYDYQQYGFSVRCLKD